MAPGTSLAEAIDWGDGSPVGNFPNGGAHHVYTQVGDYPLQVTVTDPSTGAQGTFWSTAEVVNQPLSGAAQSVVVQHGQPLSDVLVATLQNPNVGEDSSDYAVTINWGDGSESAGQLVGTSGIY